MEPMRNSGKTRKSGRVVAITIVLLLTGLLGGFYIYTLDYYRATDDVHSLMTSESSNMKTDDRMIVVTPEESKDLRTGLIFYPGGKIEAIAYIPLLLQLSQEGITCFLIEMPFNLAVFNINAANGVYGNYPEMENWFVAGHSLGGAMASTYMKKNYEKVDGLILLGAYPVNDAPVPTLAIYGSEDIRLDLTKLETTRNKLEISGGNHAQFGNYGEQKGDGTATISREEQQAIAVREITNFIEKESK